MKYFNYIFLFFLITVLSCRSSQKTIEGKWLNRDSVTILTIETINPKQCNPNFQEQYVYCSHFSIKYAAIDSDFDNDLEVSTDQLKGFFEYTFNKIGTCVIEISLPTASRNVLKLEANEDCSGFFEDHDINGQYERLKK